MTPLELGSHPKPAQIADALVKDGLAVEAEGVWCKSLNTLCIPSSSSHTLWQVSELRKAPDRTRVAEVCHGSLVKVGFGWLWFSFFRSQNPNQVLTTALKSWCMTVGKDQMKFAKASGSTMYEKGLINKYRKGR